MDSIGGFLPPKAFIGEVERIKSGKRTVDVLRKAAASAPKNVTGAQNAG